MSRTLGRLQVLAAIAVLGIVGFATTVTGQSGVTPNMPRSCYSCEGLNCQRTSLTKVAVNCTDVLDICVTIFDDFAVEAKGCYLDMPEELRRKCDDRKNPECFRCFGELCNNKGRVDFRCIECTSKDDSKCSQDTTDMMPTQCSIPTAPNSYCYVRMNSDGDLVRGCLTHVQEQLQCLNDTGCSLCLSQDGEACNGYKLNSPAAAVAGARGVALSLSTMLASIAIFSLRYN